MENLKKRHQRLEKEKNINNFFKLMAIKNICLVISISVVLTKIDLNIYTIITIIVDYSISIMRFNTIYKKVINSIMVIILLINIIFCNLSHLYLSILKVEVHISFAQLSYLLSVL